MQRRILIVEASREAAQHRASLLEAAGHLVTVASSSKRAAELLAGSKFDLLIFDGEVLTALRERAAVMPSIFLTSAFDRETIADAIRLGVSYVWPIGEDAIDLLPTVVERISQQIAFEQQLADAANTQEKLNQLCAQMKGLNNRLHVSIAETHHRMKNNLQGMVALLNLHLRNQGVLGEGEVKKIIAHVQGLASLHDVLLERARGDEDTRVVNLAPLIEKLTNVLSRDLQGRFIRKEIEDCEVTTKQGASLALVLNELVSNGLKFGSGPISISLKRMADSAVLIVENGGSRLPEPFDPRKTGRTGLTLLFMLVQTDFGTEPVFANLPDDRVQVRISIPLACSMTTAAKKEDEGDGKGAILH